MQDNHQTWLRSNRPVERNRTRQLARRIQRLNGESRTNTPLRAVVPIPEGDHREQCAEVARDGDDIQWTKGRGFREVLTEPDDQRDDPALKHVQWSPRKAPDPVLGVQPSAMPRVGAEAEVRNIRGDDVGDQDSTRERNEPTSDGTPMHRASILSCRSVPRIAPFALPPSRRLDLGDVDLLHRHHRVERALGCRLVGIGDRLGQRDRRDLQAARRLGQFVSAGALMACFTPRPLLDLPMRCSRRLQRC